MVGKLDLNLPVMVEVPVLAIFYSRDAWFLIPDMMSMETTKN